VYCAVCDARHVPEVVCLGLHIQHGSERRDWRDPEPDVELVQFREVQEVRTFLGDVAWFGGGVDHHGYEPGAAGFPAVVGLLGCA